MKKNIPTVSLNEFTNQATSIFHFVGADDNSTLYEKIPHRRDDHFLFILQKNGYSKIVVDFKEITLTENSIICILPGQVHYVILVDSGTEASLLTVDSKLISKKNRAIFEENYFDYQSISLNSTTSHFFNSCIELAEASEKLNTSLEVIYSLTNTCVCLFAQAYKEIKVSDTAISRKHVITKQFKSLLLKHFKTHKSAVNYANELNITSAYLNEAVKLITGSTVSYWIQQMILTEAKRLLYATDNTVKEIAYQLGYDDPAYFNRYFSNLEKMTPLQFRVRYRK
ncbi:helix-turn-helix domain-containing protein [Flavobacterium sp. FlaQc-48]|uniref:helix-turn-helix domain-containing protein n=1 Tax=Flavobacterium sp. FlaQc-48 TaxID=3374181 RepID=UPI0037584B4F